MGILKELKLLGKVCPSLNIVIGTVEKKVQHLITKFPNAKSKSPTSREIKAQTMKEERHFENEKKYLREPESHGMNFESLENDVKEMRRKKTPQPTPGGSYPTTSPSPLLGGGINKTTLWNK